MQNYSQAAAYVQALTGEPVETAEIWWRCIHDKNKQVAAHKYYGTLASVWQTLCAYNVEDWGIFANINAFASNAKTHELSDVWYIRTHVVDLDNVLTAQQNYSLASNSNPLPSFAVGTSPGKFHIYWPSLPYQGNDRYSNVARKLRQAFDGDKSVIDATRVLRVPGFYNHKYDTPHLVTCWALGGYGQRHAVEAMETALQHVNVIDAGLGERHALGDPQLAAPSLDWLRFGLSLIDPNALDRADWIKVTAAIKQAGWTLADEQTLRAIWEDWCTRYGNNNVGENDKQWRSIRDTEIGWTTLYRFAPTLKAYEKFGFKEQAPKPQPSQSIPLPQSQSQPSTDDERDKLPDILSDRECKIWFRNCFFVGQSGKILTPGGRFMNSTQFNGVFGSKQFVISPNGKTTDEAWKAATRSTLWTIPKVDHIRFLPQKPTFEIIDDQLGRKGINTYIPIIVCRRAGDITPFLRHMELMLPDENDRRIIYEFLAHNVKYPGSKIPWAPLIQSAEGTGKGLIQKMMEKLLGEMYTYSPPAEELVKSGSTFNSWQRNKLMIIVNEIKIDERRELIEIMKPWITDERIQIQSKGENQEMEDNPANWLFFSNYKDAIPVSQNGRRYAVFYSAIQSVDDLRARGMDDKYFAAFKLWLDEGFGIEILCDWLMNYPIERGAIPYRAPNTSSMVEARRVSRGPIEIVISNAIEDGLPGFRGGYVSVLAIMKRLRETSMRTPAMRTVQTILEQMGYHDIGRATRPYGQESLVERSQLYAIMRELPIAHYGRVQGYGD